MTVAAASGSNTTDELVPALRDLGMGLGDLEPAEAGGLLAIDGSVLTFPHPLARSAAYQAASSQDRREAHRALALALQSTELIGRRALHLAAAAVEPNEEVAAELAQAGIDARGRGASDAATSALRAAARRTPDPEQRARRLRDAAGDAHLAGSLAEASEAAGRRTRATVHPLLEQT